jgi:hypothetical protein
LKSGTNSSEEKNRSPRDKNSQSIDAVLVDNSISCSIYSKRATGIVGRIEVPICLIVPEEGIRSWVPRWILPRVGLEGRNAMSSSRWVAAFALLLLFGAEAPAKWAASDISISIAKPTNNVTDNKLRITVSVDFADAVTPIGTIQLMVNSEVRATFINTKNLANGRHTFTGVDVSDLVLPNSSYTLVARAFEGDMALGVFADSAPVVVDAEPVRTTPLVKLQVSCSLNAGGQLVVDWNVIFSMFRKVPVEINGSVFATFFNGADEQIGPTLSETWDIPAQFTKAGTVAKQQIFNVPAGGALFAIVEVRVDVTKEGLKALKGNLRMFFPDVSVECPIGT